MAKSGTLVLNLGAGSDDGYAAQIVATETPTGTLGQKIADALEARNANVAFMVLASGVLGEVRTIKSKPSGAFEDGGEEPLFVLVRDILDGETEPRKSAPWTLSTGAMYTAGDAAHVALKAAIEAVLAPVKPKMTLASLVNKIEDALVAANIEGVDAIMVDQDAGEHGELHVVNSATDINAPAAQFTQTISPEDAAALPPLAFE